MFFHLWQLFLREIGPFMHTWEENVSVSCLELCVLRFLECLCIGPMLSSRWWWHLLSALPSFHDKVRTFLRIHPGRTLYPSFERAAGFNLEDAGGKWWGWLNPNFKRPTPHPVGFERVSKQNMCPEVLQLLAHYYQRHLKSLLIS